MAIYRKVLVPCTIERGGFGNERTYTVATAGGDNYIGIAPWIYCYNLEKKTVQDEPEIGKTIKGYVTGKVISGGVDAKVSFPDGAVCLIVSSTLVTFPTESPNNVPVES